MADTNKKNEQKVSKAKPKTQNSNSESQVKNEKPVKEKDLDKIPDLFDIIYHTEKLDELKPEFYKHILKIFKRNPISNNYNVIFLYDNEKSIEQPMADKIYNAIPEDREKPLLLILNNRGGRVEPAYLISKTCKESSTRFIIAIPRKAKSAATLISLGGDEIHMGPMSELGPIDPQFGGLPALGISSSLESIAKIVCKYPASSTMFSEFLKEKLDLRILGYFERVSESAKQYAIRLLNGKSIDKKIEEVAHKFVYDYKDHSFVIDKEEARNLLGDHIKVNTDEYKFANDIHKFMNNVNLLLGLVKKKSIGIVGTARDFDFNDIKEDKE